MTSLWIQRKLAPRANRRKMQWTPESWIRTGSYAASALFVILSAQAILQSFHSIWTTREIDYNLRFTDEVSGEQAVEWRFSPQTGSLDFLCLFYRANGAKEIERSIVLSLRDESQGRIVFESKTRIATEQYARGWLRVDAPEVRLDRATTYLMKICMPDVEKGEGVQLHYHTERYNRGTLSYGNKRIGDADLECFWQGISAPFPWPLFITGCSLLALLCWQLSEGKLRTVVLSSVATCVVLLVALHFRNIRTDAFFGNYWPDEYMAMSQTWRQLFVGEIAFPVFRDDISSWRNGQALFFPASLGVLQALGLAPSDAYMSLVALLVAATLMVFLHAAHRYGHSSKVSQASVLLIAMSNPMLLRSAGSLQTDIGGIFFALLSVWLLTEVARVPQNNGWRPVLLAGLAIYLAVLTRLALLPLLALPFCVAVWSYVVSPRSSASPRNHLFLAGIMSLALVSLTWQSLDIFASVARARDFAGLPAFRDQFSWSRFAAITFFSLNISIVPMAYSLVRSWREIRLVTIGGGILGLLSLLAISRIIPWFRYWAPIGCLGALYSLAYLGLFRRKDTYASAYACLCVLFHLWLILFKEALHR